MPESPSSPAALVARGIILRAQLAATEQELLEINTQLIALGAGDYADEAGEVRAKVIEPAEAKPSYALKTEDEAKAKEIAGDTFGDLFKRVYTFDACKSFGDVVVKLLTPAKARKLLELTLKAPRQQKAYVRWS